MPEHDAPQTDLRTEDDLEALLAEPPAWPKVVGILSIIFSTIGFTCSGVGMGTLYLLPGFMETAAANTGYPAPPTMEPSGGMWLATFLSVSANVLLLVAGISTIARKPVGRTLHIVYAIAAIIIVFVSTYIQMDAQGELNQRMQAYAEQHPDSPFAQQANSPAQAIGQLVGLAFGLTIALTWPLFTLIWFTLSKRGRSSMKGSGLEAAA